MKKTSSGLAALALMGICLLSGTARAEVIAGPAVGFAGSIGGSMSGTTGSSWGLVFQANRDTFLIGFDFKHQNLSTNAGTINLTDTTTSTLVNSWNVPANAAGDLHFDSHELLHSNDVYQLTYTQTAGPYSDELFAYLNSSGSYPPSYQIGSTFNYTNADITVTNGVENTGLTSSTGFTQWFAFNNLATSVPEPSSLALVGFGCFCLAVRRRQNRLQA